MMIDEASAGESLDAWCSRSGIDLGDGDAFVIGYWCRIAGVDFTIEHYNRHFCLDQYSAGWLGWHEADAELEFEASQ